jgi:radical SAM superfamily enzyme YgiQ (UPF0313 family)
MKIALVFTPHELHQSLREVSVRDDNIGFIPPLSLLYVAAILEQEGVEVVLLDMLAERLNFEEALERIRGFSPDLLGFSITTTSFHPVLDWIKRFKAATGLPVLVGGDHITLYPRETMSHDAIDFCIVGEGEVPLPRFVQAFRNGQDFSGLASVGYKKDGLIHIDYTQQFIENIDDVPFPSRHLIDNSRYENILTVRKNFTAMLSTRGCPFNCSFCNENQQKYRSRSPKNFVDEIEYNLKQHNIVDFDIYDSTFSAETKRVKEICQEIVRRKLAVRFSIRSRVDTVSREMIGWLKSAGCHTIMFGIESSNRELLELMQKSITPELIRDVVTYTHDAGVKTLGFFMFGYPGETRATIEDTIRFSLELPLDYAQYTALIPLPGTEIYDYYQKHSAIGDYWSEYTLDSRCEVLIEFVGTEVSRTEVSELVMSAYRRFYFRPRIILGRFLSLTSFSKFMRMFRGALGMISTKRFKR